jgi:nicotinate-nucleotide adenylyltransferase
MKIAIFGGAFNPVHNEHVNIVKSAKEFLSADKLIVMPTAVSPHKSGRLLLCDDDRLQMCKLAFDGMDGIEVSDYEIAKGGVSYTYLTMQHFKEVYPNDELYFIIGADMLKSFKSWKNPKEILSYCTLACCERDGENSFESCRQDVEQTFGVNVLRIPYFGKKVSSTRVRVLASLDEDFSQYIPQKVCQYIQSRGLYLMPRLLEVKEFISHERWLHSVRVAILCAERADMAHLTEKEAIAISALHDVAKYLKPDSNYLKGFVCPPNVPEPVLHQFTGAYMALNYFNLKDERLLNAIKYHTSGRENMSEAEAVLFLSDMLEEGRNFPHVDELRELFKDNLYYCLYKALKYQVEYLNKSDKPVYDLTERAYNYYKEKFEKQSL